MRFLQIFLLRCVAERDTIFFLQRRKIGVVGNMWQAYYGYLLTTFTMPCSDPLT